MNNNTYRLESVYTLLQPLSHIGSSESTESFLNTIRVLNNGVVEEVFTYTGNAIRGMWRDCGAKYLLDRLQSRIPKKAFHLLFSGGSIGKGGSGDRGIDIARVKALREVIPFLSIFGGGVGNQILAGKFTQTFALPVCAETSAIIPPGNPHIDYNLLNTSWRIMTGEIEFSRKDDSKDRLGDKYIALPLEQTALLDDGGGKADKEGVPTQMRYCAEYLVPGSQLWHALNITCTEIELGALVSAIHEWAKSPYLGGMGGKGFGLTDLRMEITVNDRRLPFIIVRDNVLELADKAKNAKEQYDRHLAELHDSFLSDNKNGIVGLLEGTK